MLLSRLPQWTGSLKSVRKDVLHLIQFLTCQRFRCLRTRCSYFSASTSCGVLQHPALFSAARLNCPAYSLPPRPHRCQLRLFRSLSPGRFISVGLSGLEPLTPALSAQCSNLLSYRPFFSGALTPRVFTQRFASPPLTPIRLCYPDGRLALQPNPHLRHKNQCPTAH